MSRLRCRNCMYPRCWYVFSPAYFPMYFVWWWEYFVWCWSCYIQGVPRVKVTTESVPYVKIYRYNPKHLCPKLNGYGDNGQRKVLTSCISAYCTSSAVSAMTLTEQCSRHLCECTNSTQHDKIVLHYCQIFMLYVQCLVTLWTTMTWVRVFL